MELQALISTGTDLSEAPTQFETMLGTMQPAREKGQTTVVKMADVILRTIAFFCKVCLSCVLRDKSAHAMLAEYCKRVSGLIMKQ